MAKDKAESAPFKKAVPVDLKPGDVEKKQRRIVKALGEIKKTKGEAKLATAEHRKTINELSSEVEALREQLDAGTEMKDVSCVTVKDFRNNVVKTLRVDTRAVVETREMTADERQETFPELPRGAAKKRGRGPAADIAAARDEGDDAGGGSED